MVSIIILDPQVNQSLEQYEGYIMSETSIVAIVVALITVAGGILAALLPNIKKRRQEKMEMSLRKPITYGATIKLIHNETGQALHSHTFNYCHPNSSNQQQVTAYSRENTDDFWIVRGPHHFSIEFKDGEPVKNGDVIRLEHKNTKGKLHSHHGHPSPISGDQEVTVFGVEGSGDTNDNWVLEVENNKTWLEGLKIRLVHKNTNAVLHSYKDRSHPEYTFGQQEVTCRNQLRDQNDYWCAAIY